MSLLFTNIIKMRKQLLYLSFILTLFCSMSVYSQSGVKDIYLSGSATPNGWTNTKPEKMTYENGAFVWKGVLKSGEFKFLTELGNWSKCYNSRRSDQGVQLDGSVSYPVVYNESLIGGLFFDYKFKIYRSGYFHLKLDTASKMFTIKEQKNPNATNVICIGTSVTEGYGLSQNTYPDQLEQKLGGNYKVLNFGKAAMAVQKAADYPYWTNPYYSEVKRLKPDVVIIELGINDTKPVNWTSDSPVRFKQNLKDMVNDLSTASEVKPIIYLVAPCYKQTNFVEPAGIYFNGTTIQNQIAPIVREVAREMNLETMDFFEMTFERTFLYYDDAHPSEYGAGVLADYAMKVMKKLPVATSPDNVVFDSSIAGVKDFKKIRLTGKNLTEDLKLTIEGAGFSISETTISKALLADPRGYELNITFNPTDASTNYQGAIKISGGGIETRTVKLSGKGRDLYLVGDAASYGWNNVNPDKLVRTNGKLQWSGFLKAGEFKFLTQLNTWNQCYNSVVANQKVTVDGNTKYAIRYIPNSELDYKFLIPNSAFYTIVVDADTKELTVKEDKKVTDLWVAGSAIKGGSVVRLTGADANSFSYTGRLVSGELKLMTTEVPGADTKYFVPLYANTNINGQSAFKVVSEANAPGWNVTSSNLQYTVNFNVANLQVSSSFITSKNEFYLVGGATDAQWDLSKMPQFKKDENDPYIFTLETSLKVNSTNEGNRFKIMGQRSWAGFSLHPDAQDKEALETNNYKEYSAPASTDTKWTVNPQKQGRYKLTINTLENKLLAQYLGTSQLKSSTGNNEVVGTAFKVFAQNGGVYVHVEMSEVPVTAELFSSSGTLVDKKKSDVTDFVIGTNLAKGVYVVKITGHEGTVYTQKILIQ